MGRSVVREGIYIALVLLLIELIEHLPILLVPTIDSSVESVAILFLNILQYDELKQRSEEEVSSIKMVDRTIVLFVLSTTAILYTMVQITWLSNGFYLDTFVQIMVDFV